MANIEKDDFATSVLGTEGGIYLDPFDPGKTRVFREEFGTLTDTIPVSLPNIGTHEAEIRAFVKSILEGAPVEVPGEQGLMVTRILDALYASSDSDKEVVF